MKRPRRKPLVRPAGGWPWEAPGFKFYTDEMRAWLSGYAPQCPTPKTYDAGAATHTDAMRAGGLVDIDRGRGTLPDLRQRTAAEAGRTDAIRRSLS